MHQVDQEEFWAGNFGDMYIGRNKHSQLHISNLSFFSKVLSRTNSVKSVIEFGCNIGMNLKALNELNPNLNLTGIEINKKACHDLKSKMSYVDVVNRSVTEIVDYPIKYDLSITKGLLIHINPELLTNVYSNIYNSTNKYILLAEYYNPTPVMIPYHGEDNKLFKRDFCGEMLDIYKDLRLVDYGFLYHRDNYFRQDDINWFLMEKG